MMRLFAVFFLAMILPAMAGTATSKIPLIVQPYYMGDIYGNQITYGIPYHVSILTLRNFDHDRYPESRKFAIKKAYARLTKLKRPVIMLGDEQPEIRGTYISVFRDKVCQCYVMGNAIIDDDHKPIRKAMHIIETKDLYMISDGSDISKRREETIRLIMKELDYTVHVKQIVSAVGLRAALVSWNKETRGVLLINAYDIGSDNGARLRYRAIEKMITEFNSTHLEIGVYRKNHRSALAVGLDPVDIGKAIISVVDGTSFPEAKVKSSVNLNRLTELRLTNLAAGSFKEAFLYEPLEAR